MATILLADTLRLSITLKTLVLAVSTITAFTVLSALWPAVRAARLPPVTVIHQVE